MANQPENLQPVPMAEISIATKPEFKKAQPVAQFATEYFQILGLSVCSKCGDKKHTDGFGKIVCAIGITVKKECPMIDKEGK